MGRRIKPAAGPEAAPSAASGRQHADDSSFTESYTAADFARDQQEAQRDALAALGPGAVAVSPDAPGQWPDEQLGWCSVNGLFAGLSGGVLGAVFGIGA